MKKQDYYCPECGVVTFATPDGLRPDKCPYCGNEHIERLIDDSERILKERQKRIEGN
jgi:predicted RNA-binding Zn-ribbon protein involved in translation (DUF1610 family)